MPYPLPHNTFLTMPRSRSAFFITSQNYYTLTTINRHHIVKLRTAQEVRKVSSQEQKEFEAWMKTLCPWDKEWALQMAAEGKPLEEIQYYVDF